MSQDKSERQTITLVPKPVKKGDLNFLKPFEFRLGGLIEEVHSGRAVYVDLRKALISGEGERRQRN